MQQVEQQNGLRPGELDQWLASVEIPYEFFKRQIESQILWGKYVATRLRPRVIVSEEDITAEMNQQRASRGNPEYLISRIEQLRGWVVSLERWPRRVAALLLGVVTALAFPPLYILPLLIPGFVGLAWLIEGSSPSGRSQRTKLKNIVSTMHETIFWMTPNLPHSEKPSHV